ncbi:MAG: hypothetical protein J6S63_00920 [Atopobiaceae bacterium]|nr:hypothetical protein [Atopobiaceae bacterium]
MTTVTKALDHLTDVLAGSDVTLKGTKADCIMQIADMIEDGTIVIGGGGGGEDVFIVNLGVGGEDIFTCDKTCAEIAAAAAAGKAILGYYQGGSIVFLAADAEHGAAFQMLQLNGDTLTTITFIIAPDDSVTGTPTDYDLSSLVIE